MTGAPKACVIGWPIKHSRSPLVHRYWLRELGLAGDYGRAEVAAENFADFIRAMPAQGYVGGNVTVPHKERIVALADDLTDRARAIGAANTIWFEDGRLCADTTDGPGFLAHLDATHPDWAASVDCAVVLGAGGAARNIVHALASRRVPRIRIVNRHLPRAETLARDMADSATSAIAAYAWRDLPQALAGGSLLVNATSLGMTGQPPLDCPLDALREDAVVNDIVYAPLTTDLLRRAAARGLRTVDGLGMLLHQAAPGFARWFGGTPQVTPGLRALLVADIEKAA